MDNNTTSICFTGDVSFSGYFNGMEKDGSFISDEVWKFIRSADYSVINMESPITENMVSRKKRLAHRCDETVLDFINDNFNNPVVSYANNHIMDFGRKGMEDSLAAAENKGIPYIGAGYNLRQASDYVVVGKDVKIGIMALQYKHELVADENNPGPLHEYHVKEVKKKLKEMKGIVDYTVLVYHGGNEFLTVPMPYIRSTVKSFLKMGFNAVVGHHPHVVQGYEMIGNKKAFYSLGNFIFDTDYQRMQDYTECGMLLKLIFSKQGIDFEYLPVKLDRNNMMLNSRDNDIHFKEIDRKTYREDWCRESLRKRTVKKKADELEETGNDVVQLEIEEIEIQKTFRDKMRKNYRKAVMKSGQFMARKFYSKK